MYSRPLFDDVDDPTIRATIWAVRLLPDAWDEPGSPDPALDTLLRLIRAGVDDTPLELLHTLDWCGETYVLLLSD